MIKSTLTLCLCLIMTSMAFSQWSFGPKVAFGTVTTSAQPIRIIPSSNDVPPILAFEKGSSVKSLGVSMLNNLGPGFLQIDLFGSEYDLTYSAKQYGRSNAEPTYLDETRTVVEIPISAGLYVNNMKLGVGPVVTFNLKHETELEQLDRYVDKVRNLETGFQALLGYQYDKFSFEVRYIKNFSSLVDGFGLGNDVLKVNKSANRISVNFGMYIQPKKNNQEILKEGEVIILQENVSSN